MTSLVDTRTKITVEGATLDDVITALGVRRQVLAIQIRFREGYTDGKPTQLPGCYIHQHGHTTVECVDTESAVKEFRKIMTARARSIKDVK